MQIKCNKLNLRVFIYPLKSSSLYIISLLILLSFNFYIWIVIENKIAVWTWVFWLTHLS